VSHSHCWCERYRAADFDSEWEPSTVIIDNKYDVDEGGPQGRGLGL